MNEMIHNNVRMKPYGHDTQTKSFFFSPWITGKIFLNLTFLIMISFTIFTWYTSQIEKKNSNLQK